jgi:hypothetical protein
MRRIWLLLFAVACRHAATPTDTTIENTPHAHEVADGQAWSADLAPKPDEDRPSRWMPRVKGATFEQAICATSEGGASMDLVPDPSAASSRMEGDQLIVCQLGRCRAVSTKAEGGQASTDAAGTLFALEGSTAVILVGQSGAQLGPPLKNPLDADWSCGAAQPLDGGEVFVFGETCEEFPKKPFLWDATRRKMIAPYRALPKDDTLGVDDFRFWKLGEHTWVVWEWGSAPRVVIMDDRTGRASVVVAANQNGKIETLDVKTGLSHEIQPPPCPAGT